MSFPSVDILRIIFDRIYLTLPNGNVRDSIPQILWKLESIRRNDESILFVTVLKWMTTHAVYLETSSAYISFQELKKTMGYKKN